MSYELNTRNEIYHLAQKIERTTFCVSFLCCNAKFHGKIVCFYEPLERLCEIHQFPESQLDKMNGEYLMFSAPMLATTLKP